MLVLLDSLSQQSTVGLAVPTFANITLYKVVLFCKVLCKIAFLIREKLDITQFAFCECTEFDKILFVLCQKFWVQQNTFFIVLCCVLQIRTVTQHNTIHNPLLPPRPRRRLQTTAVATIRGRHSTSPGRGTAAEASAPHGRSRGSDTADVRRRWGVEARHRERGRGRRGGGSAEAAGRPQESSSRANCREGVSS